MKRRIVSNRVAFTVFSLFLILACSGLLFHSLFAQRYAQGVDIAIGNGKTQLFQKTVSGALNAYQTFQGAYNSDYVSATDAEKIKIRVYLAFTRMLDVVLRNDSGGVDTLTELLAQFGITRTGDAFDGMKFNLPLNDDEKIVLPATAPASAEALRSFFAGPFLTAVNASILDMDAAIALCPATEGIDREIISKTLIDAGDSTRPDVEMDAGDYYLFRALLKVMKVYALMCAGYNADVNIREIMAGANFDMGQKGIKLLFDSFPDFLKIRDAAKLNEARTTLIGAIDDYTVASEKIRNDNAVQEDAEELFSLEPDNYDEALLRENLAKIKTSLGNNSPADLVTERIGTEYSVYGGTSFTTTEPSWWEKGYHPENYSGYTYLGKASNTATFNGAYNCYIIVTKPGNRAPVDAVQGSVGVSFVTPATGSTSNWGNIGAASDGAYALVGEGTDGGFVVMSPQTATNFITVTLTNVAGIAREEHFNLNLFPLFGNGTTAPKALRDLLPQLNEYGYPLSGTMGHGLGDDWTLGGILPDFTSQNQWIRENHELFQPAGPVTIADRTINVQDGLVTDWIEGDRVFTDITGEVNDPARDIQSLYLAKDATYLYLRIDTAGTIPTANIYDWLSYYVKLKKLPGDSYEMLNDLKMRVYYNWSSSQWVAELDRVDSSGNMVFVSNLSSTDFRVFGNHVEMKFSLAQLGSLGGRFIAVGSESSWGEGDRNHTCLQIQPSASVTGNLSVPGYDGAGPVRIGVYEYSPNFSTDPKKRIGSLGIYPDGSGNLPATYTIANLPVESKVFVTVFWDRNNNGVISPGDYTNFYQPFKTVAGQNMLNLATGDDHPAYPAPAFVLAWIQNEKVNSSYSVTANARVTGPSPDDVRITVTVMDQEYQLLPSAWLDNRTPELSYRVNLPSWLPNGDYTLTAVDSLGRKTETIFHYETYTDLPTITTLTPGDASYTGTTTPTLSWTAPAGGPYLYRVEIREYPTPKTGSGVIWYSSDLITETSLTVPQNVLLPETAYYWSVRTYSADQMNYSTSPLYRLYTGSSSATPVLSSVSMGARPPTGSNANYSVWMNAKILGVAPWEVTAFQVKKGTAQLFSGSISGGYWGNSSILSLSATDTSFSFGYGPSTQPVSGTDYSLEMGITHNGIWNLVSAPITFTYQSCPAVDVTSLAPANNYYFMTTTPTFAWGGVPGVYQRMQIYESFGRVSLYRSGWSSGSSATVPAGVLKPGGTYLWTVQTTPTINPSYVSPYVNSEGNAGNRIMFRFTIAPAQDAAAAEIQQRLNDYRSEYNKGAAGSVAAVMSFYSTHYLDNGVNYVAQQAKIQQALSRTPFQPLPQPVGVTVKTSQTSVMTVVNWGGGYFETMYWTKEADDVWRIVGNGETQTISFTGYVADSQSPSQVISGATVQQGGVPTNMAVTNADGLYTLGNLPSQDPFYLKIYKDASYAPCISKEMSFTADRTEPRDRAFTLFPASRLGPGTGNWNVESGKGIIRAYVRDKIDGYVGGAVVTYTSALGGTYQVCYDDACTPSLTATKDKDGAGRFVIKNVLPGDTVTVTASKGGWTSNTAVYHTFADSVSQGRITLQGPATLEVTVNKRGSSSTLLSGANMQVVDFPSVSATTGSNGKAILTGLPSGVDIPFAVSKEGYVNSYGRFSTTGIYTWNIPQFLPEDLNAWNVRAGNGVVYGRVQDSTNSNSSTNSVAGAQVTYTSDLGKVYDVVYLNDDFTIAAGATATLSNGRYLLLNVEPGDEVTVTARKTGWSFWADTNKIYADGLSYCYLRGAAGGAEVSIYVKDKNGALLPGATVRVAENTALTATTDSSGKATLTNVPLDTPVTFETMKADYQNAYSRQVTLTQNYSEYGTYFLFSDLNGLWGLKGGKGAILGYVKDGITESTLAGATVTCHSAQGRKYAIAYLNSNYSIATGVAATLSNGRFLILDVEPGDTVIATAQLAGRTFEPRIYTARADAVNQSNVFGWQYKYQGNARLTQVISSLYRGELRLYDPLAAIESVTVTGSGLQEPLSLTYDSQTKIWRNGSGFTFDTLPTLPRTYTLVIRENNVVTPLKQYQYMAGVTIIPGDVNHDGYVTLADAILSLQAIVGSLPAGATVYIDADANGDGRIGIPETVYILQEVSGLRFPD